MKMISSSCGIPLDDSFDALNEEDLTTIFCSELVAEAYQELGLLNGNLPSNEYTPADFGRHLEPLDDATLTDAQIIVRDPLV